MPATGLDLCAALFAPPMTEVDLAKRCSTFPSAVAAFYEGLAAHGLVERVDGSSDASVGRRWVARAPWSDERGLIERARAAGIELESALPSASDDGTEESGGDISLNEDDTF